MGGRDAPLRRERDARSAGGSRKDRRGAGRCARARRRGGACRRTRRRGRAVDRGARATSSRRTTCAFREMPDLFDPAAAAELTRKSRAFLDRVRPLLLRARRAGLRAARPRRPASRQHRADRRPPGAVRRDRVRSADRGRRRALRSRFPADGSGRARSDRAANIVLNRYLAETRRDENLDALAALPLFMSLRAAIRAKVTAARLDQARRTSATRSPRRRAPISARLRSDRAACPDTDRGRRTVRHRQVGSGARRSPRMCCPLPGAVWLRSDVERKALFGVGETERLPAEAYSAEAGAKVYASLNTKARRIIAAGHSVVVDAVFARAEERAAVAAVSDRFHGLFLTADLATRDGARRRAPRRCLRRGRQGRARAGGLRSRHARLEHGSTRPARRRTRSSMPKPRSRDSCACE